MSEQEPEKQDLHVAELARPDTSWLRFQPIQLSVSPKRMDAPHSVVSLRNTSDKTPNQRGIIAPQTHVVLDRGWTGHEVAPGQTLHGIEMLDSEIDYYRKQRVPGRKDRLGRVLAVHPIEILDVRPATREEVEAPKRRSLQQPQANA